MNHGSVLLKDTIRLLFLQNQPFNSPTQDLRVDGDEVGGQREDLDHVGCEPGGGDYGDTRYEPIDFERQRMTSSPTNEQRGAVPEPLSLGGSKSLKPVALRSLRLIQFRCLDCRQREAKPLLVGIQALLRWMSRQRRSN